MLLELKQAAPALEAFESALRTAPGRLNALYGAARAAELSGNREVAKNYYSQVLANCVNADAERAEVRQANLFLAIPDRKY
jgi:tetratricopeptide (TPR) repeat protein